MSTEQSGQSKFDPKSSDPDPRREYQSRVTVDIDGYVQNFGLTAQRAYYNLARLAEHVEIHISSSGEGLHLVGWFAEAMPFADRLTLRRALGDDQNRLKFDLERYMNGVYTGVLWTDKHREASPEQTPERRPGKDRSFGDIHDALTTIRMNTTTDTERMNRLAEHGHRGAPALAVYAGAWEQ